MLGIMGSVYLLVSNDYNPSLIKLIVYCGLAIVMVALLILWSDRLRRQKREWIISLTDKHEPGEKGGTK